MRFLKQNTKIIFKNARIQSSLSVQCNTRKHLNDYNYRKELVVVLFVDTLQPFHVRQHLINQGCSGSPYQVLPDHAFPILSEVHWLCPTQPQLCRVVVSPAGHLICALPESSQTGICVAFYLELPAALSSVSSHSGYCVWYHIV